MQPTLTPSGQKLINDCAGLGPFCKLMETPDALGAFKAFATVVSNIIGLLTIVAGLWFGFQLIIGAFAWMSSGGDKQQLEAARNRIMHAFTGLIIVVASIAIISVFGKFLGLTILLNPADLVKQLNPNK